MAPRPEVVCFWCHEGATKGGIWATPAPVVPDESTPALTSTVQSEPTMRFTSALPMLALLGASLAAPQPKPVVYVHHYLPFFYGIDLSFSLTERALPSGKGGPAHLCYMLPHRLSL